MVHHGNAFRSAVVPGESESGEVRTGLACCPGIVRGRVQVIFDPRGASLRSGDILVAPRTDPGWIMNWHLAREQGVGLLGPTPRDLIAATTPADFLEAVRAHMPWIPQGGPFAQVIRYRLLKRDQVRLQRA